MQVVWIKLIPITSVHNNNNLLGNAPKTYPGNKQRGTQQTVSNINTNIYAHIMKTLRTLKDIKQNLLRRNISSQYENWMQ